MAIYGIGAFHDGMTDVSPVFLERGVACVGWNVADAPALHRLLRHVKVGDILYIKTHPPGRELTVKGIGVVSAEEIREYDQLGHGVEVRWLWRGNETLRESTHERYNVRSNTLYEELSPTIQNWILALLLPPLDRTQPN
jgi:hypothetical protein